MGCLFVLNFEILICLVLLKYFVFLCMLVIKGIEKKLVVSYNIIDVVMNVK